MEMRVHGISLYPHFLKQRADKMKLLKQISRGIDRLWDILFYVPVVLMVALLVVCALMVCLRKVLIGAFNWADEAMRFLMVYSTFFVLPVLVAGKRNITIDMTDVFFPNNKKGRWVIHVIGELLTLACCVILMPAIIEFVMKNVAAKSPAMLLPMWLVYSCLPIGFGLSIIASLNNLFKLFTEKKEE